MFVCLSLCVFLCLSVYVCVSLVVSELVQGRQLLCLWSGKFVGPSGTNISNTESLDSVLLQVCLHLVIIIIITVAVFHSFSVDLDSEPCCRSHNWSYQVVQSFPECFKVHLTTRTYTVHPIEPLVFTNDISFLSIFLKL